MSVGERVGIGETGYYSHTPQVDLLKSPARLLAHLQQDKGDEPVKNQLLEAAQWILCSPEAIGFCRLTAVCYDVPTKLQDGPQCGLVALWMASIALIKTKTLNYDKINVDSTRYADDETTAHPSAKFDQEKFPSVEWIQNMAKEKHFSMRGEMFSSENLASLAQICFQHFLNECTIEHALMNASVVKHVYSILTSYEKMVEFFTDARYHQVLLVPYDSDYDQRPCTKKGHKSHWCIISGIAAFISHKKLSNMTNMEQLNGKDHPSCAKVVDDSSKIFVISKNKILPNAHDKISNILKNEVFSNQPKIKTNDSDEEEEPCFYLIARQSKSKRTFLFDPFQLAVSNRNLVEVSPDQYMVQSGMSHDELFNKYVIPSGGLRAGLANQAIVLKMQV